MTLDDLKAKLPTEWHPIVAQYGPAFVAMTTQEAWGWLALAAKGDIYAAHKAAIEKLPASQAIGEWGKLHADWQKQNAANATAMQWQKDALGAVMKVMVGCALAAVGL